MLKRLVIFALLVSGLSISGQTTGSKGSPCPKNAPCNVVIDHSESYILRLISPENLPNIGLFLAGVIGIIVATRTLNAIKEQAKIANRALITQFRPKVIVRSIGLTRNATYTEGSNGQKFFHVDSWTIELRFENIGESGAHVQDGLVEIGWSRCWPDSYEPIQSKPIESFSLESSEDRTLQFNIPEKGSDISTRLGIVESAVLERNAPQVTFFHCAGSIRYLDDVGTKRKTGFGRNWDIKTQRFVASDDPEVEYQD
jgi:hypothetical protein